MYLRFPCQSDACDAPVTWRPDDAPAPLAVCTQCGREHPLHIPQPPDQLHSLRECAVCRTTELYRVKDFPQGLGLAIVLVAAISSFVLLYEHTVLAFGVLVAAALLDLVIYLIVPHMIVCYRCECRYRELTHNPDHKPFDLATSEKYR